MTAAKEVEATAQRVRDRSSERADEAKLRRRDRSAEELRDARPPRPRTFLPESGRDRERDPDRHYLPRIHGASREGSAERARERRSDDTPNRGTVLPDIAPDDVEVEDCRSDEGVPRGRREHREERRARAPRRYLPYATPSRMPAPKAQSSRTRRKPNRPAYTGHYRGPYAPRKQLVWKWQVKDKEQDDFTAKGSGMRQDEELRRERRDVVRKLNADYEQRRLSTAGTSSRAARGRILRPPASGA